MSTETIPAATAAATAATVHRAPHKALVSASEWAPTDGLSARALAFGLALRSAARDELRRRECRRAGMTFTRLADGPTRRMVAAPARIVHVSHYRVSGRPADLRGYSLA